MRDNFAVILFVLIILFILITYIVAALYFDGLISMFEAFGELLRYLWNIIETVLEAIYDTFIK